MQPPSGGCVLKLAEERGVIVALVAATFGWLCVETLSRLYSPINQVAATFGWLCVETTLVQKIIHALRCSHLRVAVC